MCFSISPFRIMSSQNSLGQETASSITRRRIGMLGFSPSWGFILKLQRGHVGVLFIHASQNKLWQHGVSTASSYMSRQMGQSQRSSESPEAAKYVKRVCWWLESDSRGVTCCFFYLLSYFTLSPVSYLFEVYLTIGTGGTFSSSSNYKGGDCWLFLCCLPESLLGCIFSNIWTFAFLLSAFSGIT